MKVDVVVVVVVVDRNRMLNVVRGSKVRREKDVVVDRLRMKVLK
jgi:hypothetical protein